MSTSSEQPLEPGVLLVAWGEALPAVLALLDAHRRDLLRHELQRFLATARFDPAAAAATVGQVREMLLQAARAAQQPAAIHATRSIDGVAALTALCEGLLATWLDAADVATSGQSRACDPQGMTGDVLFGPRLGGRGRPGATMPGEGSTADPDPGETP